MVLSKAQKHQLALALAAGVPLSDEVIRDATPEEVREVAVELPAAWRFCSIAPDDPKVIRATDGEDADGVVGSMTFLSTVEIPDRAGDIVKVKPSKGSQHMLAGQGFRTGNFMQAGGPVLWAHNRKDDLPPVGRVSSTKVTMVNTPEHGRRAAIEQVVEFTPDEDFPLSRTIANLALVTRSLRGVSVGFVPLIADMIRDDKTREKLGLGTFGVFFAESDQIELSMTPTPMNPLALGVKGKAALGMVDRSVHEGLNTLVEWELLPASALPELRSILLPLDGEKRAAAKVRGFAHYRSAILDTGEWPDDEPAPKGKAAEPEPQAEPQADPDPEPAAAAAPAAEPQRHAVTLDDEGVDRIAKACGVREGQVAVGSLPLLVEGFTQELRTAHAGLVSDLEAAQEQVRSGLATHQDLQRELSETRAQHEALQREVQELRATGRGVSTGDGVALPSGLAELCLRAYEEIATGANTLGALSDMLEGLDTAPSSRSLSGTDAGGSLRAVIGRLAESQDAIARALSGEPATASGGAAAPRHGPEGGHAEDEVELGSDLARALHGMEAASKAVQTHLASQG